MTPEKLNSLREKYANAHGGVSFNEHFKIVADLIFDSNGTRALPYGGIPTFMSLPHRAIDHSAPDFHELDVAVIGVPMDLGITNRNGTRFGPRALRAIERIGPYNEALRCVPGAEMAAADVGDIPFRSRYDLAMCHADIEAYIADVVACGALPLSVGGDHSITYSILRAIGRDQPVGMVHIDAHCDTGGSYDNTKFHHGGPFRNAVLDGVLDPQRTIQIGIRGGSEYLWEFSLDSGMTVIRADEVTDLGIPAIIERIRQVVAGGPIYVSFDIDSLDPAFAPGTGTPEIGGLTTREALALVRSLKGLNIVGADVVEVAPQYDTTTNTAQAGAQMLFELFSLMNFSPALRRNRKAAVQQVERERAQ